MIDDVSVEEDLTKKSEANAQLAGSSVGSKGATDSEGEFSM